MSLISQEREKFLSEYEFMLKLICDEILKKDYLKKCILKSEMKDKDIISVIDELFDALAKNAIFYVKMLNETTIKRSKEKNL